MAAEGGRLGDSYVIILIVDKQCQADLFHIYLKEEFFCTQKEKNLFNQKRVLVVQGAIFYSVSKMQNPTYYFVTIGTQEIFLPLIPSTAFVNLAMFWDSNMEQIF